LKPSEAGGHGRGRAADLREHGLRVTSAAADRTYWPGVVTAPEVGPGYDVHNRRLAAAAAA
jgi:hypothetical protein